jgi:dihydrofolate reductase
MRPLVYSVAASLDGFIAGTNGEFDWIIQDPTMDFGEIFGAFDTIVMGRHTYELMLREGRSPKEFGMKVLVASTTLDPGANPDVQIAGSDLPEIVAGLKRKPGKDIWLFGGGILFRSLFDAGLVDRLEVSLIPVLLGEGIPLVPPGRRCALLFKDSRTFPSGIVSLTYEVQGLKGAGTRN